MDAFTPEQFYFTVRLVLGACAAFCFSFYVKHAWEFVSQSIRNTFRSDQVADRIPEWCRHAAEAWKASGQRQGACYYCGQYASGKRTVNYLGYRVQFCDGCYQRAYSGNEGGF